MAPPLSPGAKQSLDTLSEDLRRILEARFTGAEAPAIKKVQSEMRPNGMTRTRIPAGLFDTMMVRFDSEDDLGPVCTAAEGIEPAKAVPQQEVK